MPPDADIGRSQRAGARPLTATLIDVDDPRWSSVLEATKHDFYHLPRYVALSARQESGEPAAALITDGRASMLLPIVVRPISGSYRDATTPYGYPGPLVAGSPGPGFLERALEKAVELLARHGIVSVFVRLHPLLNPEPPRGIGTLVRGGDTVSIDLRLPPDEQWRQVRGNHRIDINRAARNGRQMRFDDDWSRFPDFRALYRGTMARLSATPFYFFDDDYFEDLRLTLGERVRLAVVEADGVVAAAGLFVETCGIVQYHLSGSDPAFAREGLTKVLIDGVRRWASERGDEVLHLGGGADSGDDSLFHFKAGFSDTRHAFYTLRVIVDRAAYSALADSHLASSEPPDAARSPHLDAAGGYFPAYRKRPSVPPSTRRPLTVRRVGRGDAAALASVFSRIDTTHFRPHPLSRREAERIAARGGRDVYLLGFAGEEPVAYGMLRGLDEGYDTPSVGLATAREHAGHGYGRAMMLALHDAARAIGAESVRLRVHPNNVVARRLYESLDYTPAGMERGEILMLRDLNEA